MTLYSKLSIAISDRVAEAISLSWHYLIAAAEGSYDSLLDEVRLFLKKQNNSKTKHTKFPDDLWWGLGGVTIFVWFENSGTTVLVRSDNPVG